MLKIAEKKNLLNIFKLLSPRNGTERSSSSGPPPVTYPSHYPASPHSHSQQSLHMEQQVRPPTGHNFQSDLLASSSSRGYGRTRQRNKPRGTVMATRALELPFNQGGMVGDM